MARNLMAATGLRDAQMAIRQLARDALAEAEVGTVPVDLGLVASFQGVRAVETVEMVQAGRLIPEAGGYRIQLNASHNARKRRFTLGHEIGHALIQGSRRQPRRVDDLFTGRFDADQEEELLCDVAAAELLLPDHLFRPAAQAYGCHLGAVHELASRFEASREATARRLVETNLWPCALVIWHRAYRKSEASLALQPTLGLEWARPEPKLRVRYAVASATFGHYIPAQVSAPRDGLLARCYADGGPMSGEEMLQVGGRQVSFWVMAGARDFDSETGPARDILSLLLSADTRPGPQHDATPLWDPSSMFD